MQYDIENYKRRPRTVAFYGRVSTEHEQQLSALSNQMDWYIKLAQNNPNWHVVARYIDEGITGTQMKKRPSFMQMLEHAKQGRFDLIVTRELSRFARNTVDALNATRELKQYGVEVYFVNDGIWTMDGDGEVRLTIMASIAQDESRKTSERVKAGQKISREKGVLYGNGNILGYDRVGKSYVINEEQAATVRRIYELYAGGMGEQGVAETLMAEGRKDGGGGCTWTASKVSRVLRKPTYKGYITYNRSHTENFLDHKRVNHAEKDYTLVKGDFEPIVSEELWNTCNELRTKRAACLMDSSGRKHAYGKSKPMPAWQRVDCNASYVAQWKLELMAKEIFQQVWKDHKQEILDYYREENEKNAISPDHSEEIEKKKQLIEKTQNDRQEVDSIYRQNLIPLSTYQNICDRYDACIRHVQEDLAALESKPRFYDLKKIEESLNWEELFPDGYVSREFLDRFVSRIFAVDAQRFVWELNLSQKSYSMECGVIGTFRFPYVTTQELEEKPAADKKRRGKKKGDDENSKYHKQKTVSSDGLYLKMIRGDIPTNIWAQANPCTVVCRLLLKLPERSD